MTGMPRFKKYTYPRTIEEFEEELKHLDDYALKKLWRYLPIAKTKFEIKIILLLTDEMISRGLK